MRKAFAILLSFCLILTGTVLAETTNDASASTIDNATIDASIYLDYSAGIEAGVYQWILSDDATYYTLAAVDESGEATTTEETAINVGANNEESFDTGDDADAEALPAETDMADDADLSIGEMPEGGMPDGDFPSGDMMEGGGFPGGEGMRGGMGGGGMGSGGMHGGMGDSSSVYQGVYMNANITNLSNQTMLIYVPAAYLSVDESGNVTGINHDAVVGNYTADTAPIVYANECGGWRSSSPRSVETSYIEQGMIHVTAGARSRDAQDDDGVPSGKAPTQVVDLKSGVIALRANRDIIPGDTDRIISVGGSGGGQMSSILGATGNMPEYYEYMYEAGTLGVTKNADGTYASAYPDNIYAAQCYCPIADIEDADIAYAWWWVDLVDLGGTYNGSITDFERRLQELEADAFVEYLNGLNLTDTEGNPLTLTGLRSGTYYDAILANISDALNAMVEAGEIDPAAEYTDYNDWLVQENDGWKITDLAGFMVGTGLVNNRNKAIPGFDTMDKSAENNAFGTKDQSAVHYSRSVAQILSDNYDELSALDGFNQEYVDSYIEEALTGDSADAIRVQTNLMNATEIMLGYDGLNAVDPAPFWRVRSGTADQHTSFSIGFNICLAAQMAGQNANYHLVWNMGHGSNEGSTTGTFIDWISEICTE